MSVTVTRIPEIGRITGPRARSGFDICADCGHEENDHEQESDNAYCIGNLANRSKLPEGQYMACQCRQFKA